MDPGSHRSEALTEPSGKACVLKGRGKGVRNYWENGSVIGYPPPMGPGSHRSGALTEPSGKPGVLKGRGKGVRNYWENGSVIGYPPLRSPECTERRRVTEPSSKPALLRGGIGVRKFGFSASRGLLHQGDRRPKFAAPGKGVRNYWENGSVIGYPPLRSPERTERRRVTEPSSKPALLRGGSASEIRFSASRGLLHQGDRRPKFAAPGKGVRKLLGKWKRNRLPTLEIPGAYRTEALTEPSGNPAVLQREEEGRPKLGFWPLEASLRQGGSASEIRHPRGNGVRNS